MKFKELKKGMVLWETVSKDFNNKVFIVLLKKEKTALLAVYDYSIRQIRRTTVFRDEWSVKDYETLSTKQKYKVDSEHAREMIREFLEYSDLLYNF